MVAIQTISEYSHAYSFDCDLVRNLALGASLPFLGWLKLRKTSVCIHSIFINRSSFPQFLSSCCFLGGLLKAQLQSQYGDALVQLVCACCGHLKHRYRIFICEVFILKSPSICYSRPILLLSFQMLKVCQLARPKSAENSKCSVVDMNEALEMVTFFFPFSWSSSGVLVNTGSCHS